MYTNIRMSKKRVMKKSVGVGGSTFLSQYLIAITIIIWLVKCEATIVVSHQILSFKGIPGPV